MNHKTNTREISKDEEVSICKQFFICKKCLKFVNLLNLRKKRILEHECYLNWCSNCRKQVPFNHTCYIQRYIRELPKTFTIVFYDIETVQTKKVFDRNENIQFEHEAILVCAQKVCEDCWRINEKNYSKCRKCKQREFFFEGKNCLIDFANHLLQYQPGVERTTCIAHNASSFDSQLILNSLLQIRDNNIKLQVRGYKILRIILKRYIHFIDSLMFLPMPLVKFTKAFDIDPIYSKGFFPFLFLTFDNWHYIGSMPDKKYFNYDSFSNARKTQFDSWYEENSTQSYNLRDEAIFYCNNDVTLLRLGCLKFMDEIIDIGDVNPFVECFTLAQLALIIYRKNFMPRNKLGIVPRNNYHPNTTQSKICRKWLTYLNYFKPRKSNETYFITPEVRLSDCGLQVDGYCENFQVNATTVQKTVFEFSGCYYHACPECLQTNSFRLKNPNNMGGSVLEQSFVFGVQKYHETLSKLERLKQLGYNVVHIWEHEFEDFLKENPTLEKQISSHPFVNYSTLNARDE